MSYDDVPFTEELLAFSPTFAESTVEQPHSPLARAVSFSSASSARQQQHQPHTPTGAAAAVASSNNRRIGSMRRQSSFTVPGSGQHHPSAGGAVVAGSMRYRVLAEKLAEEEAMLRRHGYDWTAGDGEPEPDAALLAANRNNTVLSAQCYDDILAESGSDFDDVHLEHYAKRAFYLHMERREKRIRELHRVSMWSAVIAHACFVRLLTAKKRRFAALMRLKRWFRNIILMRRARRTAGMRVAQFHAEARPNREYLLEQFPFLKLFDILQGEPAELYEDDEEDEEDQQQEDENKMEGGAPDNNNNESSSPKSSPTKKERKPKKEKQQQPEMSKEDFLLPSFEKQRQQEEEGNQRAAEDSRRAEMQAACGVQPPPPIPTDVDVMLKPPFCYRLPKGCRTFSESLAECLLHRMLYVTGNHLTNLAQRDTPVNEWFLLHEGRLAEVEDPYVHVPDDGPAIERAAKRLHGRGATFGWLLPLPLPTPQGQLLLLGTTTRLWRITQEELLEVVDEFFDSERHPATAEAVKAVFARATQEATAAAMRRDYPIVPDTLRRAVPMLSNVSEYALGTFCQELLQSPKTQAGPLWLRKGAQLAHAGSLHNDVLLPCGFGSLLMRRKVVVADGGGGGKSVTVRAGPGLRATFNVPVWDERVVELTADERMLVGADELVLPRASECDVFVRSEWLAAWRFDKVLFQRLIFHDPAEFVERQRAVVSERILRQTLPKLPSVLTVVKAKVPILRHVSGATFSEHISPLFVPRVLQNEGERITKFPTLVDGVYLIAHGQVCRRRYGCKLVVGSEEHQQIVRDGGRLHDPNAPSSSSRGGGGGGGAGADSPRPAPSPFEDDIVAPNASGRQQPAGSNFFITYDCDVRDPSTWLAIGGGWEAAMDFLPDPPQRKGTAPLSSSEKWAASWDSKWCVGRRGFVLLWFIPCSEIPLAFRDMSLELKKKTVEAAVAARAAAMKIHPQVVSRITEAESVQRVPSFSESNLDLNSSMLASSSNNLLGASAHRPRGSDAKLGHSMRKGGGGVALRRTMSTAGPMLTSQASGIFAAEDGEQRGGGGGFQILTLEQQQEFHMVGGLARGASSAASARRSKYNLLMRGSPTSRRGGSGGGGDDDDDDPIAAPSYYSPSAPQFRAKPVALPPRSHQSETAKRLLRRLARMGIDGDERNDYHPLEHSSDDDDDVSAEAATAAAAVATGQRSPSQEAIPNIFEAVLSVKQLTKKEMKKRKLLHPPPVLPGRPGAPSWLSSRPSSSEQEDQQQQQQQQKRELVIQSDAALFSKKQQERKDLGIFKYERDLQNDPDTMYLGHALPAVSAEAEAVKGHADTAVFEKLISSAYENSSIRESGGGEQMMKHSRQRSPPAAAAAAEERNKKRMEIGKSMSRQDEVVLTQKNEPVANQLEALLRSARAQSHDAALLPHETKKELRHAVSHIVVSVSEGKVSALDGRTLPFTKPHHQQQQQQQQQQGEERPSSSARGVASQRRVEELRQRAVYAAGGALQPHPPTQRRRSSLSSIDNNQVASSNALVTTAICAPQSGVYSAPSVDFAHSVTFLGQRVVSDQKAVSVSSSNIFAQIKQQQQQQASGDAGTTTTTTTSSGRQQLLSSIQAIQQQQVKQVEGMSLFERENNPMMRYSRPVATELATARDFARFEVCLRTMKKKKTDKKKKKQKESSNEGGRPPSSSRCSTSSAAAPRAPK